MALQGEAVSFVEYGWRAERGRHEKDSAGGRLLRRVSLDLWLSSYSDIMRQTILRLRDAEPCALDPATVQKEVDASIPWWSLLAKIAIPNLARAWTVSTNTALDAELPWTRKASAGWSRRRPDWPLPTGWPRRSTCRSRTETQAGWHSPELWDAERLMMLFRHSAHRPCTHRD